MPLTVDQNVVEAFALKRGDEPISERVRLRQRGGFFGRSMLALARTLIQCRGAGIDTANRTVLSGGITPVRPAAGPDCT